MTTAAVELVGLAKIASLAVALACVVGLPLAGCAPAASLPSGFVALREVDPTIVQEIRYSTHHNFVGHPIDGYVKPSCILTRDAAHALKRAQTHVTTLGYTLKVYDCYRPQRAVNEFVTWARDPSDQRMKGEFYPRVDKARLFDDGYIAAQSGHSRGSTMDLTLVKTPAATSRPYVRDEPLIPCYAPVGERFPDSGIDMGTGFDCFDTLAHTDDPRIVGEARQNRDILRQAMTNAGFTNLAVEWWHYTQKNEPFPDTYFDLPIRAS